MNAKSLLFNKLISLIRYLGFPVAERSLRNVTVLPAILLSIAFGLLKLSTSQRALGYSPPHSHLLDQIFYWCDPAIIFWASSFLVTYLMVCPHVADAPRPLWRRALVQALVLTFIILPLVLVSITVLLKTCMGRAKPLTSIEHSIIEAQLSNKLPAAFVSRCDGRMFECPVGQVVFSHKFRSKVFESNEARNEDLLQELRQRGLTDNEAKQHLNWVLLRTGIGPWDISLSTKLALFFPMEKWRQQQLSPIIAGHIPFYHIHCDVQFASPCGDVLCYAFIVFLVIVFVRHFSDNMSIFHNGPWLSYLYYLFSFLLLFVVAWSRLYAYETTISDELISLVLTVAMVSFGHALFVTGTFSSRRALSLLGAARLLQTARVMLLYFDRQHNVIVWNKECERVTGYRQDEIKNLEAYINKLYHENQDENVHREITRLFSISAESGDDENNAVTEITTRNGQKKLVLWQSSAFHDVTGIILGTMAVGTEISRSERRLADVGLATSIILHEVRAEFRHIIDICDQMTARLVAQEQVDMKQVLQIRKYAHDLFHVTDDFRNYARPATGSAGLVDIAEAVTFASRILQDQANFNMITIRTNIVDKDIKVIGASALLRQTIVNLLRNAIVATNKRFAQGTIEPATIEILVKRGTRKKDRSRAFIEISDEGDGLPRWILDRILGHDASDLILLDQPMQNGNTDSEIQHIVGSNLFDENDSYEHGLGLLMAHLVARDLGGELYYRPRKPRGSTIGLSLPLARPQSYREQHIQHLAKE